MVALVVCRYGGEVESFVLPLRLCVRFAHPEYEAHAKTQSSQRIAKSIQDTTKFFEALSNPCNLRNLRITSSLYEN